MKLPLQAAGAALLQQLLPTGMPRAEEGLLTRQLINEHGQAYAPRQHSSDVFSTAVVRGLDFTAFGLFLPGTSGNPSYIRIPDALHYTRGRGLTSECLHGMYFQYSVCGFPNTGKNPFARLLCLDQTWF